MEPLTHEQKWRLILGKEADEGLALEGAWETIDEALELLYEEGEAARAERQGGLGASAPRLRQWLDDIRKYFPKRVVQVLQQDAVQRLGIERLLTEPELLETLTPDVQLAATLLSLKGALSDEALDHARQLIRRLADELREKLEFPLLQALHRARRTRQRTRHPRPSDIHMDQTIRKNLKHYQPELGTIIPETIIGQQRKGRALHHLILLIDQSGSMGESLVYSAICGSILAQVPSLRTHFVVFDTSVADLSELLDDPVELLFSTQLGGGTDIGQALAYVRQLVHAPNETIVVLISDLYEGLSKQRVQTEAAQLVHLGVRLVALLALSDAGRPAYDRDMAHRLGRLGVPAFSTTPDAFPEVMAAAIRGEDLARFA